ncbi:hypothetical protein McanMca71_004590 [Microsporum canis]|uniref:Protein kinase domain-containing protein n=1 Tax=Arthroderma otae (strain ATCC MYA-4605 / CBS 113480) TaxID=554155 RepID=C5FUQ8_ARTOC|nr:conserved hypothetical protein [Microsporum canis CBS 113480]EEQ33642.1 conserved hypothetical protein [Microsporum canis CBS 113480]
MSDYYEIKESYCTRFNIGKPPLPYFVGKEFTVRSHIPPALVRKYYEGFSLEPDGRLERCQKHPLERCLLHPPSPGHAGDQVVRFRISREVRFGDKHRSQIAAVDILDVKPTKDQGPHPNMTLIAKFYDPLYNDHDTDLTDIFTLVDFSYSDEAAAYLALEPLQGNAIPKYYGSFTLELPVPEHKTNRLVRLSLLEIVPGQAMSTLNPEDFSQRDRQMIMKNIIDTETLLHTHGVMHEDLWPRNIMINSKAKVNRQVVVIDFEDYRFMTSSQFHGITISPLLRWNKKSGRTFEFEGWIDWDWQSWLELTYEDTRDSITEEMRAFWMPREVEWPGWG